MSIFMTKMKIITNMAISADGYIANRNDNTDWVSKIDWKLFLKMVKETGCIVMGRRTYEVCLKDFPFKGALNIVMTKRKNIKDSKNAIFTNKSPKEVAKIAKEKGFDKLLIIGGGKINGAFLKAGLIDEIYLDIHPVILGNGIKVFDMGEFNSKLKLMEVRQFKKDLVLLHYRLQSK